MRMLEPASRMNEAAIWVTAKMRSRRLVLPVMRTLLLDSAIPLDDSADGKARNKRQQYRGNRSASPAPTHRMLKSTVRSSARTEKREA